MMADGVGFEPTDACTSPVFKTGALNHSATHPRQWSPNRLGDGDGLCKARDERAWAVHRTAVSLGQRSIKGVECGYCWR